MAGLRYSWALGAPADAPPPSQGTPPAQGSAEVALSSASTPHAALADTLDAARVELNAIVTAWKDLVGPEQDSTMGRSNSAAHAADKSGVVRNDGDDNDDDDDSDEDDDDVDNNANDEQ